MPYTEPLDLAHLSDADWARCYALHCTAHREQGTTARSLEEYRRAYLEDADPHSQARASSSWVVRGREGEEVIAKLDLRPSPALPGLSQLNVFVHPEARRRGVGRALVREALASAQSNGVHALEVSMFQPESFRLCESYGGVFERGGAQLSLRLAQTRWRVVDEWCARGPQRSPHVRIQELDVIPAALGPAFIDLYNRAWADQPHAHHAGAPLTLARRRELERCYAQQGHKWITLVAREPNGMLCGLTDVLCDPARPGLVRQDFTGVLPSHRGRGLAKWLKASMLRLLRHRWPQAAEVATSNADDNVAMLSINQQLGFGDPIPHRTYRFELAQLRSRLEPPAVSAPIAIAEGLPTAINSL
jgi:GNAT superfamily N-acetyltransferase